MMCLDYYEIGEKLDATKSEDKTGRIESIYDDSDRKRRDTARSPTKGMLLYAGISERHEEQQPKGVFSRTIYG